MAVKPRISKKSVSEKPAPYQERRNFSRYKLAAVRCDLTGMASLKLFNNLCIYVTGSYARLEAGEHSDIDLFFLSSDASEAAVENRLGQIALFSDIIKLGEKFRFPPFSNDGEYLNILYSKRILDELGGRADDYSNHFTARMLMLLESQPMFNESAYSAALLAMVDAYFRDYPHHEAEFRPIFLINDILRFWKTLCLNYEHKRNRPDSDMAKKRKQQVKNFKLGFSRLITCFGTVVAICAEEKPMSREIMLSLLKEPPLDRLLNAIRQSKATAGYEKKVISGYEWFLERTALTTEEITKIFYDETQKAEAFRRRNEFGDTIFEIVQLVAERKKYMRYLVV